MKTFKLLIASIFITSFFLSGCGGGGSIGATSGYSQQQGWHGEIHITYIFLPTSLAPTATFDASQMHLDLSPTNIAITTTSGPFTLIVKNGSTVLGTRQFSYYRSGNTLYPSDSEAIQAWVDNFGNATDFYISVDGMQVQVTNSSADTATMVASAVYQGTARANSTTTWAIRNNPDCHKVNPRYCHPY